MIKIHTFRWHLIELETSNHKKKHTTDFSRVAGWNVFADAADVPKAEFPPKNTTMDDPVESELLQDELQGARDEGLQGIHHQGAVQKAAPIAIPVPAIAVAAAFFGTPAIPTNSARGNQKESLAPGHHKPRKTHRH